MSEINLLIPQIYNDLVRNILTTVREELEANPKITNDEIEKKLGVKESKKTKSSSNDGKIPDLGKLVDVEREDDQCWHVIKQTSKGKPTVFRQCKKGREDASVTYNYEGKTVFVCKAHARFKQATFLKLKSSAEDVDLGFDSSRDDDENSNDDWDSF